MREIEIKHLSRELFDKAVKNSQEDPENKAFVSQLSEKAKKAMCYYSYVDKNHTLIKLYCDE